MAQARILIADDDQSITEGLGAILTDEGYEVEVAVDGQAALERLSSGTFGVALADLMMPNLDGLTLLKSLQRNAVHTECIIITGQATVDSAVAAMREGAYDYIEKPLSAEKLNRLKALIPKALERFEMQQRNLELASRLEGLTHYGELSGESEEMRSVYRLIDSVASSSASVLILGESGTGKELVARALHAKSERSKGPFFALNCAALPKDILENELFGHEKGAFTGSTNEKAGAFEMADGGTLFLDEVAEMSPDIQVKLLRAIETRSIRRLGGKKEIEVDIRIVAATNKNIERAIADATLREDLYYRLAVVEIHLPPLRERIGDIKLLANEFLARFSQQNSRKVAGISDEAWSWILQHSWPGNVRELKNAVERAVIIASGPMIAASDIVPRHLQRRAEQPRGEPAPAVAVVETAAEETLLGLTRDALFREFARFLETRPNGDATTDNGAADTPRPARGAASRAGNGKPKGKPRR